MECIGNFCIITCLFVSPINTSRSYFTFPVTIVSHKVCSEPWQVLVVQACVCVFNVNNVFVYMYVCVHLCVHVCIHAHDTLLTWYYTLYTVPFFIPYVRTSYYY